MAGDSNHGKEVDRLELEVARLMEEVDRYRTAVEDALQQIDWCIGYFVGTNRQSIASCLGANRSYIRRHLLHRAAQEVPIRPADSSGSREA